MGLPMTTATPQPPETTSSPPVDPTKSRGFGAVALVLGGFGGVLPFLPADLGEARPWLPLPFALVGLFVGIFGCGGPRRGNTWAVVGSVVCAIAVGLATVMAIAAPKSGKGTVGDGHTEEILRDELDVRIGDRRLDPETGYLFVSVTLYNKGPYTATYGVTIEVDGEDLCEDTVGGSPLPPGASIQGEVGGCTTPRPGSEMSVRVKDAHKESY
jgi:hypothetical protein